MAWTHFFRRLLRVRVGDSVIVVQTDGEAKVRVEAGSDIPITVLEESSLDKPTATDNNPE